MRGVLYGAIYSTFLTQAIKSLIILAMNLAFQVPLAGVLAIVSFIIGFFPIVGSWSVYVPVAAWLAVFRDAPGQALAMIAIGFFVNTRLHLDLPAPEDRRRAVEGAQLLLDARRARHGRLHVRPRRDTAGPDADRPAQGDPRHDHVGAGVGMVGSRTGGGDAGRLSASEV